MSTLTAEELKALYRKISEEQPRPHVCIVHPKGGMCGCGQVWRLVSGRLERVTFGGDAA